MNLKNFKTAMNHHLKEEDISIIEAIYIQPQFNIFLNIQAKEYRYQIKANLGEFSNNCHFKKECCWAIEQPLDMQRIIQASKQA